MDGRGGDSYRRCVAVAQDKLACCNAATFVVALLHEIFPVAGSALTGPLSCLRCAQTNVYSTHASRGRRYQRGHQCRWRWIMWFESGLASCLPEFFFQPFRTKWIRRDLGPEYRRRFQINIIKPPHTLLRMRMDHAVGRQSKCRSPRAINLMLHFKGNDFTFGIGAIHAIHLL